MATLIPTLTLASNDISTTEALNLTITDNITVSGPCTTVIVPVSTTVKTIVTSATTASIVFIYNTSANIVFMSYGATPPTTSAGNMKLGPGEFALIPHNTGADLQAIAVSPSNLEVRKYQIN